MVKCLSVMMPATFTGEEAMLTLGTVEMTVDADVYQAE